MEKSKAFKFHAQEIRQANAEYTKELDNDWQDLAGLLKFKTRDSDQKENAMHKTDAVFDDILTRLKTESGIQKIQPVKLVLSDKEKA